ncbi:hypothetical protein BH11BAC1_BH11BAC1_00680 [soil metagenome]
MHKIFLFFFLLQLETSVVLATGSCDITVVETCNYYCDADGSIYHQQEISIYNCNGKLKKVIEFRSGFGQDEIGNYKWYTASSEHDYAYDSTSNTDTIVSQSSFDGNFQGYGREIITHDSTGRIIDYITQFDNSGSWVNSQHYLYGYNAFGLILFDERQNWNSSVWNNVTRREYYYSGSNQIVQFNKLENAAYDTALKTMYYYDSNDSLIEQDDYFTPVAGSATQLQYQQLHTYGSGNRKFKYEFYKVDSFGVILISYYKYQYDSLLKTIFEFHFNCPDTSSMDTIGYGARVYSSDSLLYEDTYFGNISYETGDTTDTGYYRASTFRLLIDSANRVLEQSDYSTNYIPPIYSLSNSDTYTYDANGNVITHCHERKGSHIYNTLTCCSSEYNPGPSSTMSVNILSVDHPHCPSEEVPAFIHISGGTPPYQLSWNTTTGMSDSTALFFSFTNSNTQTYVLEVTDSTGLTAMDSITVTRMSINVNVADTVLLCAGQQLNLGIQILGDPEINFNGWFSWQSEGAPQLHYMQDTSFVPPSPGNYLIAASYYPSCPEDPLLSNTFYVDFYSTTTVFLGNDTSFCNGQVLELDPGVYASYIWQDSTSSASYAVSLPGAYSVLVNDSNGCSSADTIHVIVNPLPIIFLGIDTAMCEGHTLELNPGAYTSYLWQDSSQLSVFEIDLSGLYSVTVSDSNGCSNADTIDVIVNPLPLIFLGSDTTLCITEAILLNAGNNFTDYLWQDSSTTQTLFASSTLADTLIYSIRVTDSSGCMANDSIEIIFDLCTGTFENYGTTYILFPNPADAFFTIQFFSELKEVQLEIFNLLGKKVLSNTLIQQNDLRSIQISIQDLAAGIYFVSINSAENHIVQKLVVE